MLDLKYYSSNFFIYGFIKADFMNLGKTARHNELSTTLELDLVEHPNTFHKFGSTTQ